MVWSRLLPKPSHFRLLSKSLITSHPHSSASSTFLLLNRSFCTSNNDNNNNSDHTSSNIWKLSGDNEAKFDAFFSQDSDPSIAGTSDSPATANGEDQDSDTSLAGISNSPVTADGDDEDSWLKDDDNGGGVDIFARIEKDEIDASSVSGGGKWQNSSLEEKPWSFEEDEKEAKVFDFGENVIRSDDVDINRGEDVPNVRSPEEEKMLEKEKEELNFILIHIAGPNRAFGDLIAASGITDAMLDSLIALKDFQGVEGLPPLSEIEELRYLRNTRKSTRGELERQKQEEMAKARVRQVDDKGRAYGTGRRKCSIARVWVQPGDGKFVVNDKQFDVYFPMLDHRAALLRPFSETKTLGLWDVTCTVKGGGVSGQVGAIQLGISRAMQNWEPDLRPTLRSGGFLTRDPRVVERKKPGKAKARKSFQWVKR
ncbi:unnamed protein product [Dovyalis caffra]|uniref:Ribosomal protein S5 domain 2-like superfamily protein n=1 Tax=Dovyalis caffra TaxID=77055 RepID=A0AAV1RKS5_9ROSI|nr:unnamed protein product [Dovyalis caffra]